MVDNGIIEESSGLGLRLLCLLKERWINSILCKDLQETKRNWSKKDSYPATNRRHLDALNGSQRFYDTDLKSGYCVEVRPEDRERQPSPPDKDFGTYNALRLATPRQHFERLRRQYYVDYRLKPA
ncbi:hypothetical protein AVEN_37455-1 [Araneus ventricosus]|uniref:Uncharacterized protein n=1 Tax=Araneus ventricosus TaxID=182803 RepID=A0A4Y2FEI0_ARAVE|nr:hypothetical protein AVEN_37455-1 [Araneus ventricosus]